VVLKIAYYTYVSARIYAKSRTSHRPHAGKYLRSASRFDPYFPPWIDRLVPIGPVIWRFQSDRDCGVSDPSRPRTHTGRTEFGSLHASMHGTFAEILHQQILAHSSSRGGKTRWQDETKTDQEAELYIDGPPETRCKEWLKRNATRRRRAPGDNRRQSRAAATNDGVRIRTLRRRSLRISVTRALSIRLHILQRPRINHLIVAAIFVRHTVADLHGLLLANCQNTSLDDAFASRPAKLPLPHPLCFAPPERFLCIHAEASASGVLTSYDTLEKSSAPRLPQRDHPNR
jgi:hypothetical protein